MVKQFLRILFVLSALSVEDKWLPSWQASVEEDRMITCLYFIVIKCMFRTVIALIYPTARKIVDFFRSWNDCMVSLVSKSLIWLVLGYTSCWFTPVDYEFTNGILSLILTNWIWLAGNSFAEQMLSSQSFLLEWYSSSFLLRRWHYTVSLFCINNSSFFWLNRY